MPAGRSRSRSWSRSFVTPFMLNGKTPEGRATMRMHARLHTEPDDISKDVLSTVYDETTLAYVGRVPAGAAASERMRRSAGGSIS